MSSPRPENWPKLLNAYIDEKSRDVFEWGRNDCCLFIADWVKVLSGVDYAAEYRGKYNTALSAMRFVGNCGLCSFIEGIVSRAGFVEVKSLYAQRGDICVIDNGNRRDAAGIVCAGRVAALSTKGIVFVPISSIRKAWRAK